MMPCYPRRHIHDIANDRVVAGLLRADAAHHNIAAGDADAYADLRAAASEADEVGQLEAKCREANKLIPGDRIAGAAWRFRILRAYAPPL
jgi:hypothetical protein